MNPNVLDSFNPIVESCQNTVNEMTDKGYLKWASEVHNLLQLTELIKSMCAGHSLSALIAITSDADLIPLAEKAFNDAQSIANILNLQILENP